ncbi:hypothetical protein [Candidatus Entotheonella palauensis]|uniref:DoxX family protein n=1 Tax=Candidatus Entotheonella gemina TaxID=1429439 RepID=W4LGZ2_9BACT|nr:hypothetical protein [Candidatus Entotheonella palauensis]ETW97184.1 MAG: hypothetical protein ETSY2_45070 [Candidatus Entotheonella gemina]
MPEKRDITLYWILRIACVMCYVGHGAFGVITKEGWLPYFAVVGIPAEYAWMLMPVVGIVDILLGISVLFRPTRAGLIYMVIWSTWTALLRPLAGQGASEFLERAGNYGIPLALLFISYTGHQVQGWFAKVEPQRITEQLGQRLIRIVRLSACALLVGHGAFGAITGKAMLMDHFASVGIGSGAPDAAGLLQLIGLGEMVLGGAMLFTTAPGLLWAAFGWKVFTELLYPISGDSFFEFVERGGSYAAPLALLVLFAIGKQRGWHIPRVGTHLMRTSQLSPAAGD